MSENDRAIRIRALAEQASHMRSQTVSNGWNALWDAMEALDASAAPGLAIGRYLLLPSGDGREPYLIDQVEAQRVHVIYLGIDGGPSAGALDSDGWCLREVVEREIARRDG